MIPQCVFKVGCGCWLLQIEARRLQEALAAVAGLAAVCSVMLQLLQLARAGEDGSLQAQLGLLADSLWTG
jgi:hypothetical protein